MTFKTKARRAGWLLVVAAFAFGLVAAVTPSQVKAYGLVSNRYVKMSSNLSNATNTIYSTGFAAATTQSTATLNAIVIHFCSNNPIIGDTCGAPAGFNANVASLTVPTFTIAGANATSWSVDTTTSAVPNVVILRRSTPQTITSGQIVQFDLGNGTTDGITNPSTVNATFFARITMYTNGTTANFSTDANAQTSEKAAYDAGGVALSTNNGLALTAKVQEALTFCLYTGANCAAGGYQIALGDSNGVLAATNQNYIDNTPKFDLASNALGGVIVRLKGDTLRSGTFTIDPQLSGTNGCVADSTATNTEQFGLRVITYGTSQTAGIVGKYDCLAGNHMFDLANTNTTYGQPFVATAGATDVSTTNFEIAAKAANTTEAGVYKSTLQFIATATY